MVLKEVFGDWYKPLEPMIKSEYFKSIPSKIDFNNCNPSKENIFRAFTLTQLEDVRVVILGQNPYPKKGDATGLSFGIRKDYSDLGLFIPGTLQNIHRELEHSYLNGKITFDFDYTLESWAKQGVLLLNTALTTEIGEVKNVHMKLWEPFIEEVFKVLQDKHTGIVFLLWGKHAQSYKRLINSDQHIVETSHPSPMSARLGFSGSRCFEKTNELLKEMNNYNINWINIG